MRHGCVYVAKHIRPKFEARRSAKKWCKVVEAAIVALPQVLEHRQTPLWILMLGVVGVTICGIASQEEQLGFTQATHKWLRNEMKP